MAVAQSNMIQVSAFSTQTEVKPVVKKGSLTAKVKAAMELIRRVQRTEPQQFMCHDAIPIDLEGSMEIPQIPERKYVTEYLEEKLIDPEVLKSHLYNNLQSFIETLEARDFDKLASMGETNFVNKLKQASESSSSPPEFKFTRGEYCTEKVHCVDKLFMRGVGVDRSTNDDTMDYTKIIALEKYGVRQYAHKYDLGMQDYYFNRRYGDLIEKRNDPEWCEENPVEHYENERTLREGMLTMRNEIQAKQFRYLFRVTL